MNELFHMQTNIKPSFENVIRQARRRMIVGKLLDASFYSLIIFSAIALPAILVVQLKPLTSLLPLVCLALFVIGLAMVLFQLPSKQDAAAKLDQFNQTHDLLSTALYSLKKQDDWSVSILQIANHQSSTMQLPSYAGRIAPAIHLAGLSGITGVMLMGMLVQNTASSVTAGAIDRTDTTMQSPIETHSDQSKIPISGKSAQNQSKEEIGSKTVSTMQASRSPGQSESGTGRSDRQFEKSDLRHHDTPAISDKNPQTNPTASLTGSATSNPQTGEPSSGVIRQISHPWQTSEWTANKSAAENQSDESRTDPAYRDLVTDYFNR